MRPNPLWIANNQQTVVANFHQDFMASMHSNFFQGQTDTGLIYEPCHCRETGLSQQNEEEGIHLLFVVTSYHR
jgi:hypothetical protein